MRGKGGLCFDPRAKGLLMNLCVPASATAPSLTYELGLVLLIALFGLISGKVRYALGGLLVYTVFYLLTTAALGGTAAPLQVTLIAFLGLVHKVYPCGFLAGIVISTTRVSEFLFAMQTIRVPRSLVIPMAVMLRYLPAVR